MKYLLSAILCITCISTYAQKALEFVKQLPGDIEYIWGGNSATIQDRCIFNLLTPNRYTPTDTLIWVTDGTEPGTLPLADLPVPYYSRYIVFQDKVFFTTLSEKDIWETNGTAIGTKIFKEFPANGSLSGWTPCTISNLLLFPADDNTEIGRELWKSDGTTQGTELVTDLNPDGIGYVSYDNISFNGKLYFGGGYGSPRRLMSSDGTSAGTTLIKEVDGIPFQFISLNNSRLFFTTFEPDRVSLWVTDGTEGGTVMLKSLEKSGVYINFIEVTDSKLIFTFPGEFDDHDLWSTDGTLEETVLLVNTTSSAYIPPGTTYHNKIFYWAPYAENLFGIWSTDGTVESTELIFPNMNYGPMVVFNDSLFFTGAGNLYKSDGTIEGTTIVPLPSDPFQYPTHLIPSGNTLYIGVEDENDNTLLYKYSTCPPFELTVTSDASICEGQSIQLAVSGATSYSWNPESGLETTTGASVLASPLETTTYTVVGTASPGCVKSKSVTITVNGKPELVASESRNICSGEFIELLASGAVTYSWSPSENLSANEGNQVIATPTVSITYTITGFSEAGCQNSKTISITVNELPEVSIETEKLQICQDERATLIGTGAETYEWFENSQPIGGHLFIETEPSTTSIFNIIGTDTNGCSNSSTFTLIVNTKPEVTVDYDKLLICEGESVTFSASGAFSYQWSPATGLNTTTGSTVLATPLQSTRYKITGTSQAGCADTLGYYLGVIEKAEKPLITLSNVNTETPTLVSSSENGNQWFNNVGALTGEINKSFKVEESGTYRVQVLMNDCLSDFSEPFTVVITGISKSEFNIFPNPTTQFLNLNNFAAVSKIVILDVHGRHAMMLTEVSEKIDVGSLPAGIYLIKTIGTQTISARFIKQ